MTSADRALATLVAVFAPSRAEPLLSRLATPDARAVQGHAGRLVTSDRAARLGALADLLSGERGTRRGPWAAARSPAPGPFRDLARDSGRHAP